MDKMCIGLPTIRRPKLNLHKLLIKTNLIVYLSKKHVLAEGAQKAIRGLL